MSMIFDPKYRDMPCQVQKNKNDIEMLKTRLKNVYYTGEYKGDAETMTIFVSQTNFPLLDFSDPEVVAEFIPSAYLITADSYLMKVTSISYNPTLHTSAVISTLVCDIQGEDGEPGRDGQNATSLSLGTVTEGDEASATLTPTGDGVYTLDLVLPRGEQGEQGETGADGQNAVISGVTATIDSGTGIPDIDVEMSGTPQNRTFNFDFHNLKGEKGDDATSLSIGSVSTLQPTDPATASLTSDGDGNYELELGIPKGADGTNGTNGRDGKGFEYVRKIVQTTDWEVNTGSSPYTPTYYPYRAFIPIDPDLNGQSPVILNFQASDIESFLFAPYCTFATVNDIGGVYIFSSVNDRTVDLRILYYIAEVI